MNRFCAALFLLGAATCCQAAETLEVSGLVTAGQSLGSGLAGHNPNVPQTITSPLPYVGRLTYQPEIGDARFRFKLDPDGFDVEHMIGRPLGFNGVNLFSGIQRFDATDVQIDFLPFLGSSVSILNFTLDRTTGIGSWKWNEYCGGCRGVLPQATGTITSYRVVPEPSTAAWAIFLAAICVARIRHVAVL